MQRRTLLASIGGTVGAGVVATGAARADECGDSVVPGGPFLPETADVNYEAYVTNEGLVETLEHLADTSDVHYEPIGETLSGRPVAYARVGSGETDVVYVTQQHGDEQIGTEAALRLLSTLGNSGRSAADVLDAVTLHVIPRLNPDGWAPADDNETPSRTNAAGVDPNRQHHYPPGADDNPSPEAQAMIDRVDAVDADIVMDYHGQFTYRSDDCELVNTSLYWPINDDATDDAVTLSKQVVGLAYQNVDGQYGHATFDTYPGGTNPGIARNAYGIQGRGSVLVEQRGQAPQMANTANGKLVRIAHAIMTTVLEGAATGDLYDVDPDVAEGMPDRGEFYWKDLPRSEYHTHEYYTE